MPRWVLLALRGLPVIVYAAVAVWIVVRLHGLPASREVLVLLVLGAFLAVSMTSLRRLRRLAVGIAVDWFPFVVMLALYDLIRGYADGLWLPSHARPQIGLDRLLGLGVVPTVWLQHRLWHGGQHLRWYDYASWVTYLSYFFVPTILLAVLWWRSRALFRRLAVMVVLLAFAGCTTYVVYPAVPPWLAAQRGLIPPVHHLFGVISGQMPFVSFQPLWKKGTRYDNAVAAIPSLHAAYTMLVTLFLVPRIRSRVRHLLWLYPIAMAFALVYSGEHYVTDVLIGWAYALVVFRVVERIYARQGSQRRHGGLEDSLFVGFSDENYRSALQGSHRPCNYRGGGCHEVGTSSGPPGSGLPLSQPRYVAPAVSPRWLIEATTIPDQPSTSSDSRARPGTSRGS